MRVILDTNIYLNFYRLKGDQSLDMLNKLNELIDQNKFSLLLPKQIEDEFIRNKHSQNVIYENHIINFQKGLEVEFRIPPLIRHSREVEKIRNTLKRLKDLREKVAEDYRKRVFNPQSRVNQQLKKLFNKAISSDENAEILQCAWHRVLRKNPPGKKSSFGDAIIWEIILDQYTDDHLSIVSGDGDFESEIKSGEVNELLKKEWDEKTDKRLTLYKELGLFINTQTKGKKKPIEGEIIDAESDLNRVFYPSSVLSTYDDLSSKLNYVGLAGNIRSSMMTGPAGPDDVEIYNPDKLSTMIGNISLGSGRAGFCSKCKNLLSISDKYCSWCGEPVS